MSPIRVSPLANVVQLWHTCLIQSLEECDDIALHSSDGPERADSSRLSADLTPYGWTASPSLKENPCGALCLPKWMLTTDSWNGALKSMTFSYLLAHLFLTIQIWSWYAADFIVQNMCCSSLRKNYFLHWQHCQSCGLPWPMSYKWKWYVALLIRSLKSRYTCVIFFFSLLRVQNVSHRGCSLRMGFWVKTYRAKSVPMSEGETCVVSSC